eukprot:1148645-Pelagomonas_calceolata.AAC.6
MGKVKLVHHEAHSGSHSKHFGTTGPALAGTSGYKTYNHEPTGVRLPGAAHYKGRNPGTARFLSGVLPATLQIPTNPTCSCFVVEGTSLLQCGEAMCLPFLFDAEGVLLRLHNYFFSFLGAAAAKQSSLALLKAGSFPP